MENIQTKINVDYAKALDSLFPTSRWIIRGEEYQDLEWLDDSIQKPSKQVLDDERARLQKIADDTEYQRKRAVEYPPASVYLDAVVKGDQEAIQNYIDACNAVKAKYPKP
jgi:hypothetical protein